MQAQRAGEIVFIGAGRIPSDQAARLIAPANFRLIAIDGPTEHAGLRKMSVHRAMDDADTWEVFISAKNYGTGARSVPMTVAFGGSPVATHRFELKPGVEEGMNFHFKTRAAGWLEARLGTPDAFRQDSRAILELPPARRPAGHHLFRRAGSAPAHFQRDSGHSGQFSPGFELSAGCKGRYRSIRSFRATVTAGGAKYLAGAARRQIAHSGA